MWVLSYLAPGVSYAISAPITDDQGREFVTPPAVVVEASSIQVNFTALGEPAKLTLAINHQGILERMKIHRWGNPEGGDFHYVDFGGIIDESGTFDGYTIPTRLSVGWYIGSERFESEGEFFHCMIDKAIYQ